MGLNCPDAILSPATRRFIAGLLSEVPPGLPGSASRTRLDDRELHSRTSKGGPIIRLANIHEAPTLTLVSDPELTNGSDPELEQPAPRQKRSRGKQIGFGCFWIVLFIIILVGLLLAHIIGRLTLNGNRDRWEQQGRQIGQMMFAYSVDHGGKYPSGNSSTEVFQKLLDGQYVRDPKVFYVPLVGKFEPVIGQKLKPQNVGFDVTSDISPDDSDALPVVFLTGYKVAYVPRGTAAPLSSYGFQSPWPEWFMEFYNPESKPQHEMAVFYKGNTLDYKVRDVGYIPNFISANFDARGKTYRQLTPDGPLP